MTRSEKIIWLFFAATSLQLAFLQPYIILVPGEHSNLFSGAPLFPHPDRGPDLDAGRGAIRFRSPEFLVSVALVVLGVVSALNSLPLRSPSFRVVVLLASGLGGFWCARLLIAYPGKSTPLPVALPGAPGRRPGPEPGRIPAEREQIQYLFFAGSNHPLTNLIFLLSFAPLTLLRREVPASGAVGGDPAGPELCRALPQSTPLGGLDPGGFGSCGAVVRDRALEACGRGPAGSWPDYRPVFAPNPLVQTEPGVSLLPYRKLSSSPGASPSSTRSWASA